MPRDEQSSAPPWLVDVVVAVLDSGRVRQVLANALGELLQADRERPELSTADELCAQLRISRSKLDALVAAGLPSIRVGSTRRFRLADVIVWLRSQDEGRAT